jgi:hypothetical protein
MCMAKDYSQQFIDLFDNLNKDYQNLVGENRKTDLMIQDILHKIEFEEFNAAEGYCLAKQIKDIRVGRRDFKNELETMSSLIDTIKPVINNIKTANRKVVALEQKQKDRKYTPRILKEVAN